MRAKKWLARALVAALILLFACLNPIERALQSYTDIIVQSPSAVGPDINVVGIDENTLAALGPFQSWSRDGLAQMIEVMSADPEFMPAVIAIDVGFFGESADPEADARLAAAAEKAGNVIVGSNITFGSALEHGESGVSLKKGVVAYEEPYAALREHVKYGYTNVYLDTDGLVRRSLHQVDVEGELKYSFAYEVFKAYTGETRTPPLNNSNEWLIRFTGEPGAYYGPTGAGNSFIDVLNAYDLVYKYIFADGIVIIGAYATGLMDDYQTSIAPDKPMYGVEIHANVIEALMKRDFVTELARWVEILALFVALALVCFVSERLNFKLAGAACVALIAGMFGLSRLLFSWNVLISPLYAMFGAAIMYIFIAFQNYIAEARERRQVMDLLSKYLSPQVARTLANRKGKSSLSSEKRDIAVLFVDIRGFTTLSESLAPEKVVGFLNKYLGLTAKSIFDNEGTVDKFIGDATMGLFNAPVDLDDYVFHAVKAGLDMVNGAKEMRDELMTEGGKSVGFGVGVHCGEAVVGSIGPNFRMDYTAIGDTVNTASRLEGQAKAGELIVSEEVYKRLEGRIDAECLGPRQLKGKAAGFIVYRVDGIRNEVAENEEGS